MEWSMILFRRAPLLSRTLRNAGSLSALSNSKVTHHSKILCCCHKYCTRATQGNSVLVNYRNGLPVFSVPLPSRHESCEFTLKPITHTVSDFFHFLTEEDGGIDRVAIYSPDGNRIAQSTTIDVLLRSDFQLVINDEKYDVCPPEDSQLTAEDAQTIADVKTLIGQLYSTLNVEQHQMQKEQELLQKLENLRTELWPLEQLKHEMDAHASKRTNTLSWLGLGLMGLQFGVLARLTFYEYSWDIMEPVTYFITYGTSMAMFAYFVITREDYTFPEVKDRQHLLAFHKWAKKKKLNVAKYNSLKDAIMQAEQDLARLRDPLQLQLPIQQIQKFKL